MKTFKQYISVVEEPIYETADAGLAAKASKSGISIGTLRKVYNRGMAAWNSGHRPGTTPQQWAMARVNSYIGKGKGTYYGADKDLHEGDTSNLPRVPKDKETGLPKKYVAGLSKSTAKERAAHFDKADKLSDRDPAAYEPAPGDSTAKTKPSKHTLKYRAMYGEQLQENGLWDNIRAKRQRIKNGSGERMRKVGSKGAPTPSQLQGAKTNESAAWQRKEGKNPEGGLNRKGIESYRRDNPGSKLSLAVTTKPSKLDPDSKAAKRRKSFCARMSGMKAKLTSAKTANDPDSRINKSLRKWNC